MRASIPVLLLAIVVVTNAFYLPGVAPKAYKKGDRLLIKVQSLTSDESSLTFDYYQLPYCPPVEKTEYAENLGEALLGEKSFLSPYIANVMEDSECNIVCHAKLSHKEVEEFQDFTILGYQVNMRADNLPLAQLIHLEFEDQQEEVTYQLGHPVGRTTKDGEQYMLYNHLDFTIQYHPVDTDDVIAEDGASMNKGSFFIVGFTVHPHSVKHEITEKTNTTCRTGCEVPTCFTKFEAEKMDLKVEDGKELDVLFTYSVRWEESPVKWASRWDVYLKMSKDNIHWFSVVNSVVVLVFLTGIIALIMTRILRKDFAMYNELATMDDDESARDLRDETGWKLVYGDVFRPPSGGMLLCVFMGTGFQLLCMMMATLGFAVLGFLSPSNRGALVTYILIFFVLMGSVAGYMSARLCKTFKEPNQFRTTLLTGILFPGIIFSMFLLVNLVMWSQQASDAVPFTTMLALMTLWFGISLPLVFFGGYLGFKRDAFDLPVRVIPIPRQIPLSTWYLRPLPAIALSGILPFGVVFVELTVILNSLWHHRFYYLFGFLFLVFIILIVTVAEICIVLCYLQLCSEDYRWWWRSFLAGGSMAVYLFLYSTYYYLRHVHLVGMGGLISAIIHIGYTAVLSSCVWVLCGFVGCFSCFLFCRLIYGSVKID